MQARLFDSKSLTHRLKDRQVSQVIVNGPQQLKIQFSDGNVLIVETCPGGLLTRMESVGTSTAQDTSQRPTKRQLDYLAFIAKYIHRCGRAGPGRVGHRAAFPGFRAKCQPNDANT